MISSLLSFGSIPAGSGCEKNEVGWQLFVKCGSFPEKDKMPALLHVTHQFLLAFNIQPFTTAVENQRLVAFSNLEVKEFKVQGQSNTMLS